MWKYLKNKLEKYVAVVVAFAMLLTLMPATAIASTTTYPDDYTITVTDEEGNLLEGVSISVVETTGGTSVDTGATDTNGEYAVEGFKDGTLQTTYGLSYTIVCEKEGYEDKEESITVGDTDTGNLALTMNTLTFEITFVENSKGSFVDSNDQSFTDNKATVKYGQDLIFKFNPTSGYEATISDGANILTGVENEYTLSGVISNYTITALTEDIEAPAINNLLIDNADTWANEKKITYSVSDNEGEETVKVYVSKEQYSNYAELTAAGISETGKDFHTVTENGTYYVYAVDANENMSQQSVTVEKIDTTAPTISDVTREETESGIQFKVEATDTESGIASVTYSENADGTDSQTATLEDDIYKFTVEEGKDYYIFVTDNAGNVQTHSVDVKAPVISELNIGETWAPSIGIEFTVTDNGTITGVYYHTENNFSSENKIEIQGDNGNYSFNVTENGTYYIFAVDAAGNYSVKEAGVEKVDKEAPVIDKITESSNGTWVNSVIEVDVEGVSDGQFTNDKITVLYGTTEDAYKELDCSKATYNAQDDLFEFTIPKTDNVATYYVWAIDEAGNVSEAKLFNVKIDCTKPEVSVSKNPTEEWTNTEVKIFGDVENAIAVGQTECSNIVKVVYGTTEDAYEASDCQMATYNADENTYEFTISAENTIATYYVWAIDEAGNVSEKQSVKVNIDVTAPTIVSMNYVKDANKGWIDKVINVLTFGLLFKEQVYISVEANDNESGIREYQYQLVEDGALLSEDGWLTYSSNETDVEIQLPLDEASNFKGKVYVKVYDVAGNGSTVVTQTDVDTQEEYAIIKDNAKPGTPVITTGNYQSGKWTNQDVIITITGGETLSGVEKYEYRIDNANPADSDFGWTKLPESGVITINADTNATYYFKATSYTGNVSDENSVEVKVQKTLPENGECSISNPDGNEDWYVAYETLEIEITEPEVDSYKAPVTTYYALWNEIEQEPAGEKLTDDNRPVITEDGIYKLKVWTVDAAGNRCVEDDQILEEIKVDTTKPTNLNIWVNGKPNDSIVESETFAYDKFYDKSIVIKLSADCDVSGLKSIEYQKVATKNEYSESGTWEVYDEITGIVATPSDKFVIYMRATDIAGHTEIINSSGIIVDDKQPEGEVSAPDIDITLSKANANGIYAEDVKVEFNVVEPGYIGTTINADGHYSGLKEVTYRIYTTDTNAEEKGVLMNLSNLTAGTVFDGDSLAKKWTGSITVDAEKFNSNNVYVEVTAIDNAGNTRTTTTKGDAIKIDITAPTIDITYDNNSADNNTYFKADRMATIVVTERNFNSEDVVVTITNTDGVIPKVGTWTKVAGAGNGDDTSWTANVTYSADGDYTFAIAYADLVGNKCTDISYGDSVAATTFTIDKTVPTISVSYDNNQASNDKYFKANRIATIQIVEQNFDVSRVVFTQAASLNGTTFNAPVATWTHNGDIHIATIIYDADGDYTFDVTMQDMAANTSGTVNYGNSVAAQDFTVDKSIAKPVISGVENGVAYKNEVVPSISFNDVNYASYTVRLIRTRMGEKDIDVTDQFIKSITVAEQGGSGTYDSFETIADNDGIYVLTVTMLDKAGNEEVETVTFTINRFGSVYEYGDSLGTLIANGGAYVTSVTDDLIITEYNADRLVSDSLIIEITRDGKPLDEIIYEVSSEINDQVATGESGWFQYQYKISKANFAQDGVYKVSISSKDATGNMPENGNYDDKNIVFRVDSTLPEITSIVGLENKNYSEETITVKFTVFDTIGLKSIKVFVGGDVVKEVNDFASDLNNYSGDFQIGQDKNNQTVQILVEDLAGNITDTDSEEFRETCAYTFNASVLVTTDAWARFVNNPVALWGTIAGIVAVIGAGVFVFIKVRKKAQIN